MSKNKKGKTAKDLNRPNLDGLTEREMLTEMVKELRALRDLAEFREVSEDYSANGDNTRYFDF